MDETIAEILDGAQAVVEVLGGQPDAAAANRVLINLSARRCQPPKKKISCLAELNDMIARLDMPLTRQVLLERVENEIGGIRPLTREGKTVDREAFAVLVRELAEDDGLMGGPGMGAAVVGRARITLTKGESDLSAEQAIDHLGLDFDTVFANTNTSYNPDAQGRSAGTSGADVERILAFHAIGRVDPVPYVKPWEEILAHALEVEAEHKGVRA